MLAEPRALLYLSVNWSMPERSSRQVVAELDELWRRRRPECPVPSYAADLSDGVGEVWDTLTAWLAASGLPASLAFSGAGALLWLRSGRAELHMPYAHQYSVAKLLAASASVWNFVAPETS